MRFIRKGPALAPKGEHKAFRPCVIWEDPGATFII